MAQAIAPREEARRNTRARFEQWAKNPLCDANTLSAVHNVRLDKVAESIGLSPSFGQSPFAIARGNTFEAGLFRDYAARMRSALVRTGVLTDDVQGFLDLRMRMNGGSTVGGVDDAIEQTLDWLRSLESSVTGVTGIVAGPMIRIPRGVILPEALLIVDVVAVRPSTADPSMRELVVGEIKVFPDRGGHTDEAQLASARAQAGLYQHAMTLAIRSLGLQQVTVSTRGFLVFTWPGSNSPSVRADEDLTYQAIRAERGFARLELVASALMRDDDFTSDTPALLQRVAEADTHYSEACLAFCDLARRCHDRAVARKEGVALGDDVRRLLGSTTIGRALELLDGATPADDRERDLQASLRTAENVN